MIVWVLLVCVPGLCLSTGAAFSTLSECEAELFPTQHISMECRPQEAV